MPGDKGELAAFEKAVEFDAVRARIATRAASEPGRALCRELSPFDELAAVQGALARTRDARALVERARVPGDLPDLSLVSDVALLFDRAARSKRTLDPRELRLLARVVRAGEASVVALAGAGPAIRAHVVDVELEPLLACAVSIDAAIDEDHQVGDDATPALRALRESLAGARAALEEATALASADPSIVSALARPGVVTRAGRPLLAVKGSHAARVPGTLVDRDSTGEVVYVEPLAVRELANRAIGLELEEAAAVEAILESLHQAAKALEAPLRDLGARLARLDRDLALGRFARDLLMCEPRVVAEGTLSLSAARHPLLAERGSCTPIDLVLDGTIRLVVISGPNGGGKTVALKTTGIACLLALSGSFIPAADGVVPVFSELLAAAVSGDDLEHGLSTFEAHARRLAAVASRADRRSLVLLDEVGLGTDPIEGAALGRALLEHLLALGARTLATTHLGPLKAFAASTDGAVNASVEVDANGRPLYRLVTGRSGESSALVVARRAGIPEAIVARAEKILHG